MSIGEDLRVLNFMLIYANTKTNIKSKISIHIGTCIAVEDSISEAEVILGCITGDVPVSAEYATVSAEPVVVMSCFSIWI